jgi:hypothetical protein
VAVGETVIVGEAVRVGVAVGGGTNGKPQPVSAKATMSRKQNEGRFFMFPIRFVSTCSIKSLPSGAPQKRPPTR